jgi:hypothetical protein
MNLTQKCHFSSISYHNPGLSSFWVAFLMVFSNQMYPMTFDLLYKCTHWPIKRPKIIIITFNNDLSMWTTAAAISFTDTDTINEITCKQFYSISQHRLSQNNQRDDILIERYLNIVSQLPSIHQRYPSFQHKSTYISSIFDKISTEISRRAWNSKRIELLFKQNQAGQHMNAADFERRKARIFQKHSQFSKEKAKKSWGSAYWREGQDFVAPATILSPPEHPQEARPFDYTSTLRDIDPYWIPIFKEDVQ